MNTSLRAYLDAIRQFPQLARQSPQQYFRRPGKDFTRTRILHLERVAWLNISLLKSTLCVELDRFFDWLDTKRFKRGYFSEIYRKRWGIETCFHVIKSFLELANFSAYTVNNCWQSLPRFFRGYLCPLYPLQYPNRIFYGKRA
ncbi:MAG: hypothetical protein J5I94_12700 [Phaeodactylibacter sp.]|nr:hypothetical protein [Phaeodactylibacter sp.]